MKSRNMDDLIKMEEVIDQILWWFDDPEDRETIRSVDRRDKEFFWSMSNSILEFADRITLFVGLDLPEKARSYFEGN